HDLDGAASPIPARRRWGLAATGEPGVDQAWRPPPFIPNARSGAENHLPSHRIVGMPTPAPLSENLQSSPESTEPSQPGAPVGDADDRNPLLTGLSQSLRRGEAKARRTVTRRSRLLTLEDQHSQPGALLRGELLRPGVADFTVGDLQGIAVELVNP